MRIDTEGCVCPEIESTGDGTVPVDSANSFTPNRNFYVVAEHGKLPGADAVEAEILNILRGRADEPVEGVNTKVMA